MKIAMKLAVFVMAFMCALAVQAQNITQDEVNKYVSALDDAIRARNAAALGGFISDSASFVMTISAGGQTQTMRLGKREYLGLLNDTWSVATNYQYRRSNTKIALAGNKAKVSADIAESVVMDGRTISTRSSETVTLERVNGKLQLTGAVTNSSM